MPAPSHYFLHRGRFGLLAKRRLVRMRPRGEIDTPNRSAGGLGQGTRGARAVRASDVAAAACNSGTGVARGFEPGPTRHQCRYEVGDAGNGSC